MTDRDPILVVDDDPTVTAVLREFLEREGYATQGAHTGYEALAALRRTSIALLLLDLQLQDVNGLEVMREALRLAAPPDIVIITGHATLDSAIAAVEAGAAGYIPKPCDFERLGRLINGIFERREFVRENTRLQSQLATRLTETEALLAISSTLISTLDLQEALRRICREIARLVGADTAAVYLHDGASDLLRPCAAYHVPKEYLHSLAGLSLPLREQGFHLPVWRDRRPVHSDHVADDDRFSHEAFRRLRHQSGLLLPLVLDDQVAGAFYLVWWTERRTFSAHQLMHFEAVSSQVALFLRNARLYEHGERDRQRLQALNDVSRRLAEVHETDQILSLIVHEAGRLLGADAAAIRLRDGEDLVLVALTESAEMLRLHSRLTVGESLAGQVVAAGEPVAVEDLAGDTRHDPTQTRVALEAGFHGLLIVPLRTHGRTIGALSVYTKRPRRFRPDEISLVSAFADQASLAIEKGRLLQQAEDGRQVLDRLYRVAIRIQTSTDRDRRLQAFIEGAHEVLGFDRVYVLLLTPDGSALELVTTHGEHGVAPTRLPLSPAAGAFYEAFVSRRPVLVLSDDDLRRVLPIDAAYEKHPYFRTKRFVMVPLVLGDHAIGVVCADNKGSRRPISPASVEPFTLICQHLASTLENSRLYHEAEQRRREAEVVAELARDMNGSLELDAVLQRVAEGARELCGSDMAMIALRDPDSAAMVVRCRAGSRTDTYKDRRIEPGKGVGGQVLLTGRPFRTDNYAEDSRITKDYLQWAPTDASIASLAVPIRAGERIEGLLYVQNRAPRPFSDRDEVTLVRLAEHAAIAIENARLFAAERAARGDAEATATALRASEEQYRALAEGSIQGLYIHQNSIIRFVNTSMATIFGYGSAAELIGRDYRILIAPHEHARIEWYRSARLRGEAVPTRYEMQGVRNDGTPIWIEVLVSLVPWEGQPAVLGTFLDITERKRAEDALRASEDQIARLLERTEQQKVELERIFASTSDGILVLDLEGRVTALNRQGGDMLGLTPSEAVGQPLARLVREQSESGRWAETGRDTLLAVVGGHLETGAGDLEIRAPAARTIHWQATPTRDGSGATVGLTITVQDVTQEREVSQMKSDFVSFVTHQLRTPLAGIRWMLELAAQTPELPDEASGYIQDGREAAARLISLVNDLLDASRLESGKLTPSVEPISLAGVTGSVAAELAPLIQGKGHRLSVEGADAVPIVTVDPQLVRQVILNLLANAVKYTPPNGEIVIRMSRDADSVRWAIQDSGIGIPREAQRRLFEKFYRADNAVTVETEGTGLGLYLVRLIVERFGGRVWCESGAGRGSLFVFTLPVEERAPMG